MNAKGHPFSDLLTKIESAVRMVPLDDLPRLIGDLECLKALADLRMRAGMPQPTTSRVIGEIRYLTVDEVAVRFHVTPKWLYRHKRQMPHSQPSRKVLLFPEQEVIKWFATRRSG